MIKVCVCVSFHLVSSSSPHLFRMFVFLPLLALWMSLTFPPFSFSNESALYFRFFPTVFFFPFRCSDFRVCVYVCVFFLSEYSLSQHPSCVGLCFFFHFLNVLPSTSHIYIYISVRPPISVPHGLSCGDPLCLFHHAFFFVSALPLSVLPSPSDSFVSLRPLVVPCNCHIRFHFLS